MKLQDLFLSLFLFVSVFAFLTLLIFGQNYLLQNPYPNVNNYFAISNNLNLASSITGGTWSWNILGATISLEVIHQIIIWLMIPFIYIFQFFSFLIAWIVWIFAFVVYPFTFIPQPFQAFFEFLLIGFIGLSILTSIRIAMSGLGE
ncbi:MAG: hypothetical protein QW478_07805 [Candidatus Micrarchaeaceae archaeon]